MQYWIIHSSCVDRTSCVTRQQSAVYWCLSARFPDHTRQCFLQILPTVAFLFFFRTDSTDSPDCLPALLRMSVYYYYFFLFRRFNCWFRAVLIKLTWAQLKELLWYHVVSVSHAPAQAVTQCTVINCCTPRLTTLAVDATSHRRRQRRIYACSACSAEQGPPQKGAPQKDNFFTTALNGLSVAIVR